MNPPSRLLADARLNKRTRCPECGHVRVTDYCVTCAALCEAGHSPECRVGYWINVERQHFGHVMYLSPQVWTAEPRPAKPRYVTKFPSGLCA